MTKAGNFVNNTRNEIQWVKEHVSSAIDQAGQNFNARWEARADPIHQAIDNPFSMITGVAGVEGKVTQALTLEAKAAEKIVSTESKILNTESQIAKNAAQGKAFEQQVVNDAKAAQNNVVEQLTVKTKSGTRTRIDVAGIDKNTQMPALTEAKSSMTAPLTKAQRKAFPEIEKSGAIVVGKGKPGFPGGTQIPPTKVNVVRPKKQE